MPWVHRLSRKTLPHSGAPQRGLDDLTGLIKLSQRLHQCLLNALRASLDHYFAREGGVRGRGLTGVARLAGLVAIVVVVFVQEAAGGMCQRVAGREGVAETKLLREHLPDSLHAWCLGWCAWGRS